MNVAFCFIECNLHSCLIYIYIYIYIFILIFILFYFQSEVTQLQLENTNLKKQVLLCTQISNDAKSDHESNLQNAISKKNSAFLELRDSFDDVIAQKDSVIDSLRKSVNKYRDESLNAPQKYQEKWNLSEALSVEKDKKILDISKKLNEFETNNTWLREELDRIITEKKNLGGKFENISSGLRSDLELALKERKEHGDDIEIHCLELEREMKSLQEERSSCITKLKLKENIIEEKNIVIINLQNQIEDTSEKIGYQILQEQLGVSSKNVTLLSEEKNRLIEQLSEISEMYNGLMLEVDLIKNEKNQLKLESNSQIEDILVNNAVNLENLKNSFEESSREKDDHIGQLHKLLGDKEEESNEVLQFERNLLQSKIKDIEESYTQKINDLEIHLDAIVTETKENIEVVADTENLGPDQFTSLEKHYNNLMSAKDEKINYISTQLSDTQQKCTELYMTIKEKEGIINTSDKNIKSFKNEIGILKETNRKLADVQASDIKQTIITKGKQLKDLRDEFETVFTEKNNIIESIRGTLKSSRGELTQTQQKLRNCNESNRNLEQKVIEMETDKFQIENKLSCLLENKTNLNSVLLKEQQENKENKVYIEDILAEKSDLMLSCTELKRKLDDVNCSSKEKSNCNSDYLVSENESIKNQMKDLNICLDELKANILEKEVKLIAADDDLDNAKKTILEMENALVSIDDVVKDVSFIYSPNKSILFLHETVQQLLNKLLYAHEYCENLNEKLYEMMEPSDIQDISNYKGNEKISELTILKTEEVVGTMNQSHTNIEPSRSESSNSMLERMSENIVKKNKQIESLENCSAELKNDFLVLQNIFQNINTILENVPDLDYYDDAVIGVPTKIEQLVNNLSSSQKYCDELSKKMHELMEQKPVQDFSSQCKDDGKELLIKYFEDRIHYLQKELVQAVDEKEDIDHIVREKYDDILENLREDLEDSKKGYKLLQEENFSLKNQLDVFTNVNIKRLQLDKAELKSVETTNVTSKEATPKREVESVSLVNNYNQESKQMLEVTAEKEVTELKSSNVKLRKLCKKYKAELQCLKNDFNLQNEEMDKLNLQVTTSSEITNNEKIKYEQEIKNLRDEINILVVDKDGIVDSFKDRSAQDLTQMKEMYQISLNKFTHDIQTKDNLIEKHESEIERLTVNLAESIRNVCGNEEPNVPVKNDKKLEYLVPLDNNSDGSDAQIYCTEVVDNKVKEESRDLLKKIDIMENQMIRLKEEKQSCLTQIKSHREEIAEFVQQRDKMVESWQSKLESTNKGKEELEHILKNEIMELNKRIESHNNVDILSIGDHPPVLASNQQEFVGKEPHSLLCSHFPACEEVIAILQSQNNEKDLQLQSYQSTYCEMDSKLNHEYQVTNSLSENINFLKSKNAELAASFKKEFQQEFQKLVNEKNIAQQDLIVNRNMYEDLFSELYEITSSQQNLPGYHVLLLKLEQFKYKKDNRSGTNLTLTDELQSELTKLCDQNAELSLRIITLNAMLEEEVKINEKKHNYKCESTQNKQVMLSKFKTTASNLNYCLKTIRSQTDIDLSIMRETYTHCFRSIIPSMINEEYYSLKNQINENEEELAQKLKLVNEVMHQKQVAESRLFDVVGALQDLGAVEKVQVIFSIIINNSYICALASTGLRMGGGLCACVCGGGGGGGDCVYNSKTKNILVQ